MRTGPATFGFLLTDAARLLRARFDRAMEEAGLGLTPGEARALVFVSHFAPIRQSHLAERMSVEPMTLVGFIDRLEARGLVARAPDPEDRRAKTVQLTPAALPLVEEIKVVLTRAREDATRDFSQEEIETMRRLLDRMRSNLCSRSGGEGA
ncbi:DNA-binding MarR family transcriptional regulator [Chelatococcus caeni]|uniref:DNA-binding MarR family transcriptional regulator n=1 Tax=Chelatococcus caeni TaxID=1348468 RepID=A0A840BWL6_9HYPH|nr:MarR family transcriptional regulator [Chelatococcus caeni]MBB4016963.1 DNA-binding MarR family transcriptional regulator [Chelatococcus caeni]